MEEAPTRTRSRALPLAVGIVLLVTAIAQAVTVVVHEPAAPVLLRLRLEEGQTVSYRAVMEMEARVSAGLISQPVEVRMELDQDWLVREVEEDGSATIEIDTTVVDASSPQGGVPAAQLESIEGTSTMRLAPDGSILDATFGGTGGITGPVTIPGLETLTPSFPEEPVAPGDRWDLSGEVPLVPGGPTLSLTGEAVLDRYEEVHGIRSAVIVSEGRMPFDFELDLADLADVLGEAGIPEDDVGGTILYEGELTMSSRQWVDPQTGLQVRAEGGGGGEIAFSLGALPQNGEVPTLPRTSVELDISMTLDRR